MFLPDGKKNSEKESKQPDTFDKKLPDKLERVG
jgi:hypothetical protein